MMRAFSILGLILCCSLAATTAKAQVSEGKVKAATVLAIARFMEWPDHVRAPGDEKVFYLGILPEASSKADFQALEGKKIDGRKVKVFQVTHTMSKEQLQRYDLIFGPSNTSFQQLSKKLGKAPVLTIVDGGASLKPQITGVELQVKDKHLTFTLHLSLLRKASLRPKAELLKVAGKVVR